MIVKPTVLVLGAGASEPYGFPVGVGLMNEVLETLSTENPKNKDLIDELVRLKFSLVDIEAFHDALNKSGANSVDSFLENRMNFANLGKIAITICLIRHELEDNLFKKDLRGKSWYEFLFNKMIEDVGFDSFENNNVSIVTFNYDRSLEHFLFTALRNRCGKTEDECAKKLSKINIIHVYGKIGALPWQKEDEKKKRPYNNIFDIRPMDFMIRPNLLRYPILKELVEISRQIIIVPENKLATPEFELAVGLLSSAQVIYFLGFGYHKLNLRRLKIRDIARGNIKSPIITKGTALGLGDVERARVKTYWKIELADRDHNVFDFLKNDAREFIR